MSVVVDASVLVAAILDSGAGGVWAEQVLGRGPIYGPELVSVETTNIIRRLERAKQITRFEANSAHQDHLQLNIELYPFAPFADRIWAMRHVLTSYDAWYVAVAEALKLPLATLDRRLARAGGTSCEFLLPGDEPR